MCSEDDLAIQATRPVRRGIERLKTSYSDLGKLEKRHISRSSVTGAFSWNQTTPLARGNSIVLVCTNLFRVETSNFVRHSKCGSGRCADLPLGMLRGAETAKDTNSSE